MKAPAEDLARCQDTLDRLAAEVLRLRRQLEASPEGISDETTALLDALEEEIRLLILDLSA